MGSSAATRLSGERHAALMPNAVKKQNPNKWGA